MVLAPKLSSPFPIYYHRSSSPNWIRRYFLEESMWFNRFVVLFLFFVASFCQDSYIYWSGVHEITSWYLNVVGASCDIKSNSGVEISSDKGVTKTLFGLVIFVNPLHHIDYVFGATIDTDLGVPNLFSVSQFLLVHHIILNIQSGQK